MNIGRLRCEYLTDPLGVDVVRPRLSWILESSGRGQRQTAYQILVASTPRLLAQNRGDLWNSGKVRTDQSIQVVYAGKPLESSQRCHWKARVWDRAGKASGWSAPALWEMGLLEESDWSGAHWIAGKYVAQPRLEETPVAPLLRKEFSVTKLLRAARAHISGLGYFELFVNGRKIGDHVLDPGFTRYDQRVLYVTHDITANLVAGRNAVGVVLGNGMYHGLPNFDGALRLDRPKLIVQLRLEFADGTVETVISDASWKKADGPIVFNGVRNGETYDARAEQPGWDTPGYDDRGWTAAQLIPGPGGVLVSQMMEPIKVTGTIRPVALAEVKPGVWVYDLGQAFAGWAQLSVSGPAGATVKLKYAERLGTDGDIDTTNIGAFVTSGEFQTDRYILKGQGTEVWEPRFTYHGFRYVQVTGYPGKPILDSLRGRVVHTALGDRGGFSCSNALLNQIQHMVRWSTLGNYHSIPTDCPHREKQGWTGDAMLSAEQVLYNFDPRAAYRKWLNDFRDVQRPSGQLPCIVPTGGWGYNWGNGPAWDSAYLYLPWYLYLYCGDTSVLAEHYDGMKRYVDFLATMAEDHLLSFGLGDWCPPSPRAEGQGTPVAVTSTAYYFADATIVAEAARRLGRKADAKRYGRLAKEIKAAFIAKFCNPRTGTVTGEEQTALACALYFGLVEPAAAGKVLGALVAEIERTKRHIDCGILGTKYVMHVLNDHDRNDLAYAIATQTDFPSWGYWISLGATTLWETWTEEANVASRLHHMFSDIGAWFYQALAGIMPDPAAAGFKSVILKPHPVADLTWVKASHVSPYGLIGSDWRVRDGRFVWKVTVPVNTTATVYVPARSSAEVREGGKPISRSSQVKVLRFENGRAVLAIGSGNYEFESVMA